MLKGHDVAVAEMSIVLTTDELECGNPRQDKCLLRQITHAYLIESSRDADHVSTSATYVSKTPMGAVVQMRLGVEGDFPVHCKEIS